MPGQMGRRRNRFAAGSRKSDCSNSGFRRRMSRTVSESQEYLYAPRHGRARIAASSPCSDGSKRKCTCARMRTPCLIDLKYCYISTPARDGADRREERVVHCDQPCTARVRRAVQQSLDHSEERGQPRCSTMRGERPRPAGTGRAVARRGDQLKRVGVAPSGEVARGRSQRIALRTRAVTPRKPAGAEAEQRSRGREGAREG